MLWPISGGRPHIESPGMSLPEVAPHEFRRLAAEVTEIAADYLSSLDLRPVFPKTSGEETRHLFQAPLPEDAMGAKAFTRWSGRSLAGWPRRSGVPVFKAA